MLFEAELQKAVKKKLEANNVHPTVLLKIKIPKNLEINEIYPYLKQRSTPISAHFRNQTRWRKSHGRRKNPQILKELSRENGFYLMEFFTFQENIGSTSMRFTPSFFMFFLRQISFGDEICPFIKFDFLSEKQINLCKMQGAT